MDSKIFGIQIDEDDIEYESFDKYYLLYRHVIYKDFVKMINDLDIDEELKKDKLKDVEKANTSLEKDDYYSANNYIIEEWGSYDKMLSTFRDGLDDYFSSDEFKKILQSIDSFSFKDKESVKDLVKEFSINPRLLNKNINQGQNRFYDIENANFVVSMYKKLGTDDSQEIMRYLRIIYGFVNTIRNDVYIKLSKSMGTKEFRRYISCVEFYFQNVNNIDPQQKA
jgi:hypothetical protein